jgi:hypothetical protein
VPVPVPVPEPVLPALGTEPEDGAGAGTGLGDVVVAPEDEPEDDPIPLVPLAPEPALEPCKRTQSSRCVPVKPTHWLGVMVDEPLAAESLVLPVLGTEPEDGAGVGTGLGDVVVAPEDDPIPLEVPVDEPLAAEPLAPLVALPESLALGVTVPVEDAPLDEAPVEPDPAPPAKAADDRASNAAAVAAVSVFSIMTFRSPSMWGLREA